MLFHQSAAQAMKKKLFIVAHLTTKIVLRRVQLKRDGTRAETQFCLSAKRMSPFKSAGALGQPIAGSRGVRISGSNAGYTKFRGSEV